MDNDLKLSKGQHFEIGERIRQRRLELGLSLTQLARMLGKRAGCPLIIAWETGRAKPGADYLIALAVELRVTTDWLLFGEVGGGRHAIDRTAFHLVLHVREQLPALLEQLHTLDALLNNTTAKGART
jgi:transcriptional regulator with XRE-family HTH domain